MNNATTWPLRAAAAIIWTATMIFAGLTSAQTALAPLGVTPPSLGTTASYGAFSGAGAIENTGLTVLTGDIGTNAGAFTGFPPGKYTGAKHVADPQALVAKGDLTSAWNQAGLIPCDTTLGVTMGNGQVLTPRTYCTGPATTLTGKLTFDAKGDAAAVFVVKVGGALNAAAGVEVLLKNGAQAANIYWRVDGAVSVLDNSRFKGTILANGAIHLYGGSTLEGRALALVGAVTMASNLVSVPISGGGGIDTSLVIIDPAQNDTLKSGQSAYQIKWAGSGIASQKKLELSLNGGQTWSLLADISTDSYTHLWAVPDTASLNARVRITDRNGLSATSGTFVIARTMDADTASIAVLTPSLGETVATNHSYMITWSGTKIAAAKDIHYSLDGGTTWTLIGSILSDVTSLIWNTPDETSTMAIVRVTDGNGVSGRSGTFLLAKEAAQGSITVTSPAQGASIAGGSTNVTVSWVGVNVTALKWIELSLDGGSTWQLIGSLTDESSTFNWANVPNVATAEAYIRVTDANGVTGTSGKFSITTTPGVGSINSLTLNGLNQSRNIGNAMALGIEWTFTPEIGESMSVEYTTNFGATWVHISTVQNESATSTSWMTPPSGYHSMVYIRVTSSHGMSRTSAAFSIGSVASVQVRTNSAACGLSNYPNPVSSATNFSFTLLTGSNVTLSIHDAIGRLMAVVANIDLPAGTHIIPFDASLLGTGTYSYVLSTGEVALTARMVVAK